MMKPTRPLAILKRLGLGAFAFCAALTICTPGIAKPSSATAAAPAFRESAHQLGLTGPAVDRPSDFRWSTLQGTVHRFDQFLTNVNRNGHASSAGTITGAERDAAWSITASQGSVRLVPQRRGWGLEVDTRGVAPGSRIAAKITQRSDSRLIWSRTIQIDVLPTQTQLVTVPPQGTRVQLGATDVIFDPYPATGQYKTAALRWAQIPSSGSMIIKLEPLDGGSRMHLPSVRMEQSQARTRQANSNGVMARKSIIELLDTTQPYELDWSNLRHVWNTYTACYEEDGEIRLPSNSKECVMSTSGQLTSLISRDRPTADWSAVTPVLFVHGFATRWNGLFGWEKPYLAGGKRTWGNFPELLRRFVGAAGQRYVPFEYRWNTDTRLTMQGTELAAAINSIYKTTGKRVIVVGYSFGGALVRTVLQKTAGSSSNVETEKASQRISAFMSIVTPHAGIFDDKMTAHRVAFPKGGQADWQLGLCPQLSCHVMGRNDTGLSEEILTKVGADRLEGEDIAELHTTRDRLPPIRIMAAIGNQQVNELFGSDWHFGEGDSLITYEGQRFLPSLRSGAKLKRWETVSSTGSGALVSERLLGFLPTINLIRVGDLVPASSLEPNDPWARGYLHATSDNQEPDGGMATGTASAPFIPYHVAGNCLLPVDCQHASWKLFVEFLAAGDGSAPLPHSGITGNQCYSANSSNLVVCGSPQAIALSGADKQDGMYTTVRAMSYSTVGGYTIEECVKDNVTGLIWEGKTATGFRAGSQAYGNWPQGGSGQDVSDYVPAVNAAALCGYSDWRLPTVDELETLVDSGKSNLELKIRGDWFPNTRGWFYWTSSGKVPDPYQYAWYVDFASGDIGSKYRGAIGAARLVRSSP